MTDQQLIQRLRAMSEPYAAPPGDFTAALFDRLVVESGLRGDRSRSAPIATLRLALLVAAVIVALLTAALVGGRLVGPTPQDAVERSRALYADPPAFQAVVVDAGGGSRTISADGQGTWRVDTVQSSEVPTGASTIWSTDGPGAEWDPANQAWRPFPAGEPPPFPLQTEIAWSVGGAPGSMTCADWSEVGDDRVAGRSARQLHCGERDQDFWLDRETLLVLRVRAGTSTPTWTDGAGMSVSELRLESLDPALFVASPIADRPAEWPSAVDVGQPIPDWSGVTLDGASAGSEPSAGRPQAILVWSSWCPPCLEEALPLHRTLAHRTDVDVVTIAMHDKPAPVRAALAKVGVELPTVIDDGSIEEAFGVQGVPLLILVDGAGVVRALAIGPVDAGSLATAVDALVAGGTPVLAIPSP